MAKFMGISSSPIKQVISWTGVSIVWPLLQSSGDPFEMFNAFFGGGMGGAGGGQQRVKFNMGGSGGGGMGGGGIEDILGGMMS